MREGYETWVAGGKQSALNRASQIAADIMDTHQLPPLPADVDRELTRILDAVEKEKTGG